MKTISVRITDNLDKAIRTAAHKAGDRNLSAYLQRIMIDDVKKHKAAKADDRLGRSKNRATAFQAR